jgi:nucleoside-diphosphate-sugar epimerase
MRVLVTGASGWIGSAVVPELIGAGHKVVGLARSDASAAALTAAGAEVHRGTIDDLDTLRSAAAESDGVIHLAFRHDIAFSGDFQGAADSDRRAIETFGEALAGTDRPFVIASGTLGLLPGQLATERDGHDSDGTGQPVNPRMVNAEITLALATRGVRSSVVRLPPTVHGDGDNGFVSVIVGADRAQRASAYIGDGGNRWPAVHVLDAARLFRLALEQAPASDSLRRRRGGADPRDRRGHRARARAARRVTVPRGRRRAFRLPGRVPRHRQPRVQCLHPRASGVGAHAGRPHRRSRTGPLLPPVIRRSAGAGSANGGAERPLFYPGHQRLDSARRR